jgi:hypothetical protein
MVRLFYEVTVTAPQALLQVLAREHARNRRHGMFVAIPRSRVSRYLFGGDEPTSSLHSTAAALCVEQAFNLGFGWGESTDPATLARNNRWRRGVR